MRWQLGQTHKLAHSPLVTAELKLSSRTCGRNSTQRADRKTTYCHKCGEDQSWRLHASSALGQCNHPLPPRASALSPCWPLFLSPLAFSPFSLFHTLGGKKGWTRMTAQGGTINSKSLPPSVLFTSVNCRVPAHCCAVIGRGYLN